MAKTTRTKRIKKRLHTHTHMLMHKARFTWDVGQVHCLMSILPIYLLSFTLLTVKACAVCTAVMNMERGPKVVVELLIAVLLHACQYTIEIQTSLILLYSESDTHMWAHTSSFLNICNVHMGCGPRLLVPNTWPTSCVNPA
jgi:hypothetical protein